MRINKKDTKEVHQIAQSKMIESEIEEKRLFEANHVSSKEFEVLIRCHVEIMFSRLLIRLVELRHSIHWKD